MAGDTMRKRRNRTEREKEKLRRAVLGKMVLEATHKKVVAKAAQSLEGISVNGRPLVVLPPRRPPQRH
jgi:hypothetical protein